MASHPLLGDALKLLGLLLMAIGLSAYILPFIPSLNSNHTYTPGNLPLTETALTKTQTILVSRTITSQGATGTGSPTMTIYGYTSTATTISLRATFV